MTARDLCGCLAHPDSQIRYAKVIPLSRPFL